jgi:hypothetical protein
MPRAASDPSANPLLSDPRCGLLNTRAVLKADGGVGNGPLLQYGSVRVGQFNSKSHI